ncbi:MAG: CYTH domain-containing protein [Bacteroidetes bacterium]|nr:CYTH domain-containing protein [Bacteroidota bacterium]
MPLEIEHKYLVRKDLWYAVQKPPGVNVRQGYLLTGPDKTIRVRTTGTEAYLTIKGASPKASRAEYEYPIPVADADELLKICTVPLIEKIRYRIEYAGKTWEVDEFFGENEGLILAEIELISEGEKYNRPSWVGEEVTGDKRYYNAYLAQHPFSGTV